LGSRITSGALFVGAIFFLVNNMCVITILNINIKNFI